MIKNVTLGCDPELFIYNTKDKEIISAIGLFGGTKKNPKAISSLGHAVQEDNVLVEFNIPPSSTQKEFIDNINYCKRYINTICKLYGGLKIDYRASARLAPKYLKEPKAKAFSCSRDLNVYMGDNNPRIDYSGDLRTAGGHIAVGYDNPSQEVSEKLIYAMEMTLGLHSLFLDKDNQRRELYGQAGSFRFTPFGIEYRTLSNFWIRNNSSISWAYKATKEAIKLVNSGRIDHFIEKYAERTEAAINNNDKESAQELLKNIEKELTTELEKI